MRTTDALANLSSRGQDTHREIREKVVKALLGPGDPWTRQEVAKAAWKRGSDVLDRLREDSVRSAWTTASGHRRDLFDLTRVSAHVTGDPLARETAREAAKRAGQRVKDEAEALRIITAALRRPHAGDGFHLVVAGAVAERAHDENWADAVMVWVTNGVGAAKGGLSKLAALQYAERVARGEETPRGLEQPQALPEMVASMDLPWAKIA